MSLWGKRAALSGGVAVFALLGASAASAQVKAFDVPAEDAATSIPEFANQAGLQIIAPGDRLKGIRTPAVKGSLDVHVALAQLLAGTKLEIGSDDGQTVLLRGTSKNGSAAPVDGAANRGTAQVARTAGAASEIETVVVSAQKKTEDIQSVPVSVTAVNTSALLDKNQSRLQDYYNQVPGLVFTPLVEGNTSLTIRGVTSGGLSNPTVGITVDDVPFGAASILVGGLQVPDLDPTDLTRIEVLEGPQGTLYGASSLGGLIKFVTRDPSTDGFSGRIQAGAEGVNGGGAGYSIRGSVNVPLSDDAAMRISAFTRDDPGYIDDVATGATDVNTVVTTGGHFSFLWRPTETLSVKLGAIVQDTRVDGSSDQDFPTTGYSQTNGLGDLQQYRVAGTGYERNLDQSYSAIVDWRIADIKVTSITGFSDAASKTSLDYTYLVSGIMQGLFGVSGGALINKYTTNKFSEELRADIPVFDNVDWLVGGYYTTENSHLNQNIVGLNPTTGVVAGSWSSTDGHFQYFEIAGFTDATWHVTDALDLQVGARESHIKVPYGPLAESGPRFGAAGVTVASNQSEADAFTYLVTPSYKISSDLMIYARFASGYRPGAPNTGAGVALGQVPLSYTPDRTYNYEAGLKGDFFDHLLTLDASLYYIDWQNIQLSLSVPSGPAKGQTYTGNAGAAKSQGFEVSAEIRPSEGLTLSSWVAYDQAAITDGFPSNASVFAATGSRLPTSPLWSGNISADQSVPITSDVTGFLGGSLSLVGDRYGAFLASGQTRAFFPSYAQLNLDAGVSFDTWKVTFFANNVADKRGILNGGLGDFPPFGYNIIQPRTVGVNFAKTF